MCPCVVGAVLNNCSHVCHRCVHVLLVQCLIIVLTCVIDVSMLLETLFNECSCEYIMDVSTLLVPLFSDY